MNRRLTVCLAAAAAALGLATATRAATIALRSAPDPVRYSDAGPTPVERERSMAALGAIVQQLAQRLPADARLEVEFVDIDLAGQVRPTPRGDLRIVRGAVDAPVLVLRWSLVRPGEPTLQGDDRLHTLAVQPHPGDAGGADPYRHERRLLEDWFARRFGTPH